VLVNRFRGITQTEFDADFINTDKFLRHAISCSSCDYSKRDFLFRSGSWRGSKIKIKLFEPRLVTKKTLLIGHGDRQTHFFHVAPYLARGYEKFWAINAKAFGSTLNSLPLGLTNPTSESQMHSIFGDTSHFEVANYRADFPVEFDGSIYGNFSIGTNPRIRGPLAKLLCANGSIFIDPIFTKSGRIEYLSSLRRNSLTVCPEGNGVDTHRLWETLYMGGTPVITQSNFMADLVRDLPVIVLKDWSKLNDLEALEIEWNQLNKMNFDFDKLKASFWIDQFCKKN
jgi:hypothetical protein